MPPQHSSHRSSGVLVPTPIVDINGVQTSRNKRVETTPSAASEVRLKAVSAVPARPQSARIDGWSSRVSPEFRDAVDSSYNKAHRIVQRRPLPDGMTLSSRTTEFVEDGTLYRMYSVSINDRSDEVARVDWNGTTGFVDSFESPPHLVAHLMSHVKNLTDDADDAPPLFADEMSVDGYCITKNHLPETITEHPVIVGGVPLLTDSHFDAARTAIDSIADLGVVADEYYRSSVNDARELLDSLQEIHDAHFSSISDRGAALHYQKEYYYAQVAAEEMLDGVIERAEWYGAPEETVHNLRWYRRSLSYGMRIDEDDDDY